MQRKPRKARRLFAGLRFQITALGLTVLAAVAMVLLRPGVGLSSHQPPSPLGSGKGITAWQFSTSSTFTDSVVARLNASGFDGQSIARDLLLHGVEASHLSLSSAHQYIDRESQRCLAEAIYHEARGQSVMGRLAVADVILNRLEDKRFPATVCDVIYEGQERGWGCQFSFVCTNALSDQSDEQAWRDAMALSELILQGFQPPITNFATYYHADYVRPRWSVVFVQTTVIDDHLFYRPPGTMKLLERRYLDPSDD